MLGTTPSPAAARQAPPAGGASERERQRERQRQRQRETERETERDRETERETERQRERDRERQRDRERVRERDRDRDRDRGERASEQPQAFWRGRDVAGHLSSTPGVLCGHLGSGGLGGVPQVNPVCSAPGPAELASPHVLRVRPEPAGDHPLLRIGISAQSIHLQASKHPHFNNSNSFLLFLQP